MKAYCAALFLLVFGLSRANAMVSIDTPIPNDTPPLTTDDVTLVLKQGIAFLKAAKASGIVCVTDREGHILCLYRMSPNSSMDVRIDNQAITKARTAAFFESEQDALTTRTAQFIVQSHFPPGVKNLDGGPLFGVPFSNLPGSDVQLQQPSFLVFLNGINAPPGVPAGSGDFRPPAQPLIVTPLTDDLGGVPLFKKVNGKSRAVGAVGIEIDGFGVLADGIPDAGLQQIDANEHSQATLEEAAAFAAQKGFEPPSKIRADRILVNGFRFPYSGSRLQHVASSGSAVDLSAEGHFEPFFDTDPTTLVASTIAASAQPRGVPAQEFPRQGWVPRFPPKAAADGSLSVDDVKLIVQQAADQAFITRGAIRRPIGVAAQVFISVTDLQGNILGVFRTNDSTIFSFDVAVQKARTAAFFSTNQVAFSSRALGFLSQTLYPPGISDGPPGPLSGLLPTDPQVDPKNLPALPIPVTQGSGPLTEISQLLNNDNQALPTETPLNKMLQDAVITLAHRMPHIRDGRLSPVQLCLSVDLSLGRPTTGTTPPSTTLQNGITIFPGGVPLYKNGVMVGALGVSGDGVDQDDVIAFAGSKGFRPPDNVRCDNAAAVDIVTALQAAIAKMMVQFPNLTDSANHDAVLDIVQTRLNKGADVLQGLRLPYVKFPRSLRR